MFMIKFQTVQSISFDIPALHCIFLYIILKIYIFIYFFLPHLQQRIHQARNGDSDAVQKPAQMFAL